MSKNLTVKKYSDVILAFIFMLFILLPLINLRFPVIPALKLSENRKFNAKPVFSKKDLLTIPEYSKKYEAYINDNIIIKSYAVKLNSLIKYFLFNVSSSDKVIKGKEEWLYFVGEDGAINRYEQPLKEESLDIIIKNLDKLHDHLHSKHIEFIFFMVPDKQTIYPEYLPSTQKTWMEMNPGIYSQISRELLKGNKEYFLDILSSIMEKKKIGIKVYYKTDSHINNNSINIVYHEIIKKLNRNNNSRFIDPVAYKTYHMRYSGDLATNFLSLENILYETDEFPSMEIPQPEYINNDKINFKDSAFVLDNYVYKSDKTIFMMRDSQSDWLIPYLSNTFKKIISLQCWDIKDNYKEIIDMYKPDIVIFECVERATAGVILSQFQ